MIENRVSRVPDRVKVQRIIISVYDKSGLDTFLPSLLDILPDVSIFSTGGTYEVCKKVLGTTGGKNLSKISDYTGQPEMHGGLVKTLDYRIYLGLLSEPFNPLHKKDLSEAGAVPIDMVVANLYPFTHVIAKEGTDGENARSNIDIGGPCMLRAAAKNYIRAASVCRPEDYVAVLEEMKAFQGSLSLETRFRLAVKAFQHTAAYDAAISSFLSDTLPEKVQTSYEIIDGEYNG